MEITRVVVVDYVTAAQDFPGKARAYEKGTAPVAMNVAGKKIFLDFVVRSLERRVKDALGNAARSHIFLYPCCEKWATMAQYLLSH